jgi:hypothetical protein
MMLASGLLGYSLISASLVYPHHLAYFNDFAGGSGNGYKHLLGSSVDWGQNNGRLFDLLATGEDGWYLTTAQYPITSRINPSNKSITSHLISGYTCVKKGTTSSRVVASSANIYLLPRTNRTLDFTSTVRITLDDDLAPWMYTAFRSRKSHGEDRQHKAVAFKCLTPIRGLITDARQRQP